MKRVNLLILSIFLAFTTVVIPAGQRTASAEVVTAYPQYVQFEKDHYGELISSGYVENFVMASQTTPGSTSGGWSAGTYHKYEKYIEAKMDVPIADVGKYRYWIVVEPTTSTYGNGGNGVTTKYEDLYASSDNDQSYNPIWSSPQNGQAIGASTYSVSTGYHVYSINGDFSGPDSSDVATGSYYDISRMDYYPAQSTTQFKYRKEWGKNYYETMKSVSYRVYRTYTGITQAPEITVTPSQNYHTGKSNSFTLSKPTFYANTYEKTNGVLQYRLNGSAWKNYNGAVSIADEGQVEIESRLITNNTVESVYGTAYSRQDNTPPTKPVIQLDTNKWYQSAPLVINPGTDIGGSGVAGVDYSISGAINQPLNRLSGMPILAIEGISTIKAITRDNVGWGSEEVSQQLKIDRTPPASVLNAATAPAQSNVIKVKGFDSLSGMMFIGLPNGTWYNGASIDYPVSENGTYTFKFQDAAENISTQSITINNIDSILPVIDLSENGRAYSDQDVTLTIHYSDANSGVDQNKMFYKWTQSKAVPTNWDQATSMNQKTTLSSEGQWYLHTKVADLAGNITRSVSDVFQLQRQPKIPDLKVLATGTDKVRLTWTLPDVAGSDGYTFILKNNTTGRSWTLSYPTNQVDDTSLSSGSVYDYVIQAKNHVGESQQSQVQTGLTLPDAPVSADLTPVERQYNQATIQIKGVQSATAYHVTATDLVTGRMDVNQTVSGDTYQTLSGFKPFTLYDVAIHAVNSSGESSPLHTSFMSLPDAPSGFRSVQIKETSIALSWHTVTDATYRSVTADTYYELDRGNTRVYQGAATEFIDQSLDAGTKYDYAVAAGNQTGMSAQSYLSSIATLPSKVQQLKQIQTETKQVTIAWKAPKGVTGYELIGTKGEVIDISGDRSSYTLTGLFAGETHMITLRPRNSSGYGAADELLITTLPDQPIDGAVQVKAIGENEATFVIPEVAGATKYLLKVNGHSYEVSSGETTVQGLEGGKVYPYTLAAGNLMGYGETATGQLLTRPITPTHLQTDKHSPTSFTMSWDAVASATSYIVRDQAGALIEHVTAPSYTASNVKPGATSEVTIEAVNATGSGKKASYIWRTLPGLGTDQLDGLVSVEQVDVSQADLLWPEVPGADGYTLYDDQHQVVAKVNDTRVHLQDLASAHLFTHYSVVPFNATGEGAPLPVPDFVTKPSDQYTLSYSSSKKKATISVTHDLKQEVFVVALRGEEVYRGQDNIIEVDNLFPDSTYSFDVWTENQIGDRSIPKVLQVHTQKIREDVQVTTEQPTKEEPIQIEQPETAPATTNNDDANKSKKSFIDIDRSFAKGSITRLADMGIIQGTTEELYEPARGTTRAEFMALLVRLTLTPEQIQGASTQDLSFTDIQADGWYIPELQAAIKNGIAKGFSSEDFRPNALVDREQASKMIAGSLYGRLTPDAQAVYADDSLIAPWAAQEVRSLTANQIVEGYPDQTFRPKANLTRAEAAAVIDRSMNKGLISTPLSQ